MKHRIRCAVLAVKDDSLLLVRHDDPEHGVHWGPPGGGLAGAESIFEAGRREFHEETGAIAEVSRIAYIEQFVGFGGNEINFYFLADSVTGTPSIQGPPSEPPEWIGEVRYVPHDEMRDMEVWPRYLNERLWDDLAAGFQKPINVGVTRADIP